MQCFPTPQPSANAAYFRDVAQNWPMMLLARTVYGIGAEPLYVTQTTILAAWFDQSGMSLAMSAILVSTRSSSVANTLVGPLLSSPVFAFEIGLYLSLASWIASILLCRLHTKCVGGRDGAAWAESVWRYGVSVPDYLSISCDRL